MLNVSIITRVSTCPNCGAPVEPLSGELWGCQYCQSSGWMPAGLRYRIPAPLPLPIPSHSGWFRLGGQRFWVLGRLARGAHSDVFLGRRDSHYGQLLLVKCARSTMEPLAREWQGLQRLCRMSTFLRALLAFPLACGSAEIEGKGLRQLALFSWRSRLTFTLEEATHQYPRGIDPEASIWMWNRLLEQLSELHSLGWCHRQIRLEHLLVDPQNHGLALCGWSQSGPGQGQIDLAQSGQCIAALLGSRAPRQLRQLALDAGNYSQAKSLQAELGRLARQLFGSPRFHPFDLKRM